MDQVHLYCDKCREMNIQYSKKFIKCEFCYDRIHEDCRSWSICSTCWWPTTIKCNHCNKQIFKCQKCQREGCGRCLDRDSHKEKSVCKKNCR